MYRITKLQFLKRLIRIPATALIVASCASTPEIFYDHDSQQSFDHYRSFGWMGEDPVIVSGDTGPSPVMAARIQAAAKSELERRGYRYCNLGSADFVVSFTVGARDRIEIRQTEMIDYYGAHWRWGYDYYGIAYPTGFPRTTVTTREYSEGSLSIDIFDAKSKRPVWHGTASKRLTRAELKEDSAESTVAAVAAILAGFPPTP